MQTLFSSTKKCGMHVLLNEKCNENFHINDQNVQ